MLLEIVTDQGVGTGQVLGGALGEDLPAGVGTMRT